MRPPKKKFETKLPIVRKGGFPYYGTVTVWGNPTTLFVAGVSIVLVMARVRQKGESFDKFSHVGQRITDREACPKRHLSLHRGHSTGLLCI